MNPPLPNPGYGPEQLSTDIVDGQYFKRGCCLGLALKCNSSSVVFGRIFFYDETWPLNACYKLYGLCETAEAFATLQ